MQTRRRAGLSSFPGGLLQNEFVECQIRDCPAKPGVLCLKILQPLHLLGLEPSELLAPAVVRNLAHADLADCNREHCSLGFEMKETVNDSAQSGLCGKVTTGLC
jgi:hypothetical protein